MSRDGRAARHLGIAATLVVVVLGAGDVHAAWPWTDRPPVTEASVRGHMEMLAGDAMHGRGSGTRDEWIAATYIASELRRWGLEPLGDAGGFVQTVVTPRRRQAATLPPAATAPASSEDAATEGRTWNVLARLPGADPRRAREVILLSAHLDHLGVRGTGPDTIYNGADDDASGVTAVLELARVLAAGERPDRTIVFAWFGSEEAGGFGARHFVDEPPVPLATIVASLEFEMIGRPDPAVPPGAVWLTGYERSTLGPTLVRHGAPIVADPHIDEGFFERSDNIRLARRGVVAQTVSTFGLYPEYHTPADDLAHIDFTHLTGVIQAMVGPVEWLADSSFVPAWLPGMQPAPRP
jgi:hypothetical protein